MSGAGLFACPSRRLSRAFFLHFSGLSRLTMKSCCEPAAGPPPRGPLRHLLRGLLYAALAAVLGFVLWQQFGH